MVGLHNECTCASLHDIDRSLRLYIVGSIGPLKDRMVLVDWPRSLIAVLVPSLHDVDLVLI